MVETMLGYFQHAVLQRLNKVGHVISKQRTLFNVGNYGKCGAYLMGFHYVQERMLQCMVTDCGWIIEADGDINHATI